MENCYYSSALGRNICDDPFGQDAITQSSTTETLNTLSATVGLVLFLVGFLCALTLIVVRYWHGSRKPSNVIFNKPMAPWLLGSVVVAFIGFILVLSGNEVSLMAALSFIVVEFFVFLALVIVIVLLTARYAMRVAMRTGHSRVGFIWLSVLSPGLALIICLILDKDLSRYSREGEDTYKLKS